jgi:hypothetical protein
MNPKDTSKTKYATLLEIFLILFIPYGFFNPLLILALFFYLLLGPIFFSTPNLKEAIDSVRTISQYNLPESFELKYSKTEFWGSSMCFVFKYPEGYYTTSTQYNYLNQKKDYPNNEFQYDFGANVPNNQGCYKFINKLDKNNISLFKQHGYYAEYGRGSKIFISEII